MKHRLSIDEIRRGLPLIDPSFLNTPQFISKGLSDLFDCQLTVKIETLNPIKSFKGRGAEMLISQAAPDEAHRLCQCGKFWPSHGLCLPEEEDSFNGFCE